MLRIMSRPSLPVSARSRVDRIAIDTEHDYVDALDQFFQMRSRRLRH